MTTTALPEPDTLTDTDQLIWRMSQMSDEIDKRRWQIGELAISAVEQGMTLSSIKKEIRMEASTLSDYYHNTAFYPKADRDDLMEYEGFTWSMLRNIRRFITGDYNQRYAHNFEGAKLFLDHCANEGAVTADQVRREIQLAKGKPKPRKRLADHVKVMVSYDHLVERHYIELPQGEKLPPEIGVGLFEIDIFEVQS